MKKLMIGTAMAALAAATISANAAPPAADPNCKMGGAVGNGYAASQSWSDHYHCWAAAAPRKKEVAARVRAHAGAAKDPMCNMSGAAGNGYAVSVSWAETYHCWK